ncbi:DNA-processing protein DprA [Rhizobium leguminosarum]|uniref:DNA-processing protein DprA n=1 Tax=Rhizobium leguminosarum TaxID=384 RepID=UPI00293DFADD|nr:DNA-processing protein DprA [Rhizobium leguminosarum]MDV4160572.1 DNA-processing protein DprA [Rhizobium leguminosarum]MDV4170301.1 DNA-processing protein DprA [Rhizobium leguminosarum]
MPETASRTTVALLALMKLKGVGRRAALRIVDRPVANDADEDAIFERAARQKIDRQQLRVAWPEAEEQVERSVSAGIAALSLYDDGFPLRLRDIPDPPAVLFCRGDPRGLSARSALAIVGTREPTDYGERVAHRSAVAAAEAGFVIVSGLAHGCDAFAHRGCVDANGVGVAVMAHGLDKVYPVANKALAQDLIDGGGCLISEYPIGMTPVRTAFAERDRLQSGLSDGVLVIETDVKGGTMHTVRFARQQMRLLACVDHPHNWRSFPKTQGNQAMIADRWAEPIANGDALNAFLIKLRDRSGRTRPSDNDPQSTMAF